MNILGKRSDLSFFTRKSKRKKEKSVVSFMHEQKIICGQTQLDQTAQEQTVICRQLFAGHVVGSRPVKRKKIVYYKSNNNSNYFLLPSKSFDIELKLFNGSQPFFFLQSFCKLI